MSRDRRAFGVMDCRAWDGGFLGLEREWDAEDFLVALEDDWLGPNLALVLAGVIGATAFLGFMYFLDRAGR